MNDPRAQPSLPTFAGTLEVFRHRPFLLFWIGACVSNTGNWTENAAQSWAVTSQMVGNPHQGMFVEMLQFADFCPVLVLALLAGVSADRVNRKTWLLILQTVAGVLGAGLAVAAWMGKATPVVVIVFTFLEGIVWALNGPVFFAGVPSLVPKNSLDRALALNSIQFNLARLCGPMLAAALIGVAGAAGAFTLNACTLLPLLAVLFFIPTIPKLPRTETTSMREDIQAGLKFVWTRASITSKWWDWRVLAGGLIFSVTTRRISPPGPCSSRRMGWRFAAHSITGRPPAATSSRARSFLNCMCTK